MSFINAIILGVVQGLTEFFPISSSAHLKLTKLAFGISEISVNFDLACHLGTLFALIWFFRGDIQKLFKGKKTQLIYLFVALLPLIPFYFFLGPVREFASKPEFLGLFLMVTGAILLLGQKIRFKRRKGLIRDVFLIGAMQSVALIPGISRSASTISCAQALGWNAKKAVRFSFMLAIPTILGGNFLEMRGLWKTGNMMQILNIQCLVGFIAAFLMGMLVIRFAIVWLEKGKLKIFAWYCLVLGLLANFYFYGLR